MPFDKEYIKDRVVISETGCWEWTACRDRLGYGQVSRVSTGESLAHRLSYRIHKGPVEDLTIRHTCDNPSCVNPDHLEAGTQADNLTDMREKGRGYIQQKYKLSPVVVISIATYLRAGYSQRQTAKLHNISESHLSTLKHKILEKTHGYR